MPVEEGHRHATIDPQVMAKIAKGHRIAELLPFMDEVLQKQEEMTIRACVQALHQDELHSNAARDSWVYIAALRDLRRHFERLTREAEGLSSQLQETLEEGQNG